MALGAITLTSTRASGPGIWIDEISIVGAASYTAGGDTGFKAAFQAKVPGARTPLAVIPVGLNGGYTAIYDLANDTFIVRRTDQIDDPEEDVPNGTNLAAVAFKLLVISY